MRGIDLLIHARQALIDGRPEDALSAMTRFHEHADMLDPDDAARAGHLLIELEKLAEAGRIGVGAARRQVIAAIEMASGVSSYDKGGQRIHNPADRRPPMRF